MARAFTRLRLFPRALRVALCYVVALQAIVASFTLVSTGGYADPAGVGTLICHNAEGEPAKAPGVPNVPCTLCAVAVAVVDLPPGVLASEPSPFVLVSHGIEDAVETGRPPARAGSARAPPTIA